MNHPLSRTGIASLRALSAGIALARAPVTVVHAQQPMAAASAASAASAGNAASSAAAGNKAAKPPVDAAASRAGVATKKPAKPGAQSGPMPASAPQR
jgi:hypothetical protein